MASDYVKSLTRTFVPILVGAIATALAHAGLSLPANTKTALASLIGGVVGALWYSLVRLAERKYPKLGWLLGVPGAPTYPKVAAIMADVAAVAKTAATEAPRAVRTAAKTVAADTKKAAKKTAAKK